MSRNVDGTILTGKSRSTLRNSLLVPLYSPQISHRVSLDQIRACVERGRRLTAWSTAPPRL